MSSDDQAARRDFYRRIGGNHLHPLWESMASLVPEQPRSPCIPYIWKYAEVRPALMEACGLISADEAIRRVLVLENPGLPGSSAVTQSLYAGLQVIMPGEVAPSHRHTQTALRLVVEGKSAYTSVEGERVDMQPGDFIVTPSWTWHDHGNEGSEAVVWLDGLDIPLMRFFDCGFAENSRGEAHSARRRDGDALARYGSNLLPVDFRARPGASPLFAYPFSRSRAVLLQLTDGTAPDPCHGMKMRFVNPATGGPAIPTMGAYLQRLPEGFSGQSIRSTDGAVFHVVEGNGAVEIGGRLVEFGPRDTFVVPSWTAYRFHGVETASFIFSFSDRPVQEALCIWREERLA
ncbi:MAG: gentisate 1,2-dioxygenase [Betaproteobacteria bacterium]